MLAGKLPGYDLYVFCANTYNWSPDWQTARLIGRQNLQGKNVVAITLGSGSTGRSKQKLDKLLRSKDCRLLGSRTFWLLRPNDETRQGEKNVVVANDMARVFGEEVGKRLSNSKKAPF